MAHRANRFAGGDQSVRLWVRQSRRISTYHFWQIAAVRTPAATGGNRCDPVHRLRSGISASGTLLTVRRRLPATAPSLKPTPQPRTVVKE